MSGNFEAVPPPGDFVGRDNRSAGLLVQLAFKPMAQRDCPEALYTGHERFHVPLHLSECRDLHNREVSTRAARYVPFKERAGSSPELQLEWIISDREIVGLVAAFERGPDGVFYGKQSNRQAPVTLQVKADEEQ
jgi:hypothetical protein